MQECISQFAATDKNLFTKKQDRKLSNSFGTNYLGSSADKLNLVKKIRQRMRLMKEGSNAIFKK